MRKTLIAALLAAAGTAHAMTASMYLDWLTTPDDEPKQMFIMGYTSGILEGHSEEGAVFCFPEATPNKGEQVEMVRKFLVRNHRRDKKFIADIVKNTNDEARLLVLVAASVEWPCKDKSRNKNNWKPA